jgi:hypothetical protein
MSLRSAHQPDPAAEIDRLTSRWDALAARLAAAGLIGRWDLVTCEVWSHGATVVVTDPAADRHAYAIDATGQLFRFGCSGARHRPCRRSIST